MLALLALGSAAPACGPEAWVPPGDAAMTSDARTPLPPSARYYRGRYVVPPHTTAADLSPVDEAHWIVSGDQVVLAYSLPRLLVGGSVRVALAGTFSPDRTSATLSGPAGTATCATNPSDGALMRCDERFAQPDVDLALVTREAQRTDPANVDARVAVAQRFLSDPIGIFEVSAELPAPAGAAACTANSECATPGLVCHIEAGQLGVCEPPDAPED